MKNPAISNTAHKKLLVIILKLENLYEKNLTDLHANLEKNYFCTRGNKKLERLNFKQQHC